MCSPCAARVPTANHLLFVVSNPCVDGSRAGVHPLSQVHGPLQGSVPTGVALTGTGWDTVVVGLNPTGVTAYNAATGASVWSFGTQDIAGTTPVTSLDGSIVYASAGSNLYALISAWGMVSVGMGVRVGGGVWGVRAWVDACGCVYV